MSSIDTLCQCFKDAAFGCCAPAPQAPVRIDIDNPPGLPAFRFRIGTFTTFRRAMLDQLLCLAKKPGHPFAAWRERADGDYLTMLVELWAYLADVLTFYQERIANEAFLPTATQRDSLLRLCRLIDYRPSPGSGASGSLAFMIEKNKEVLIPAGFRAGNKPVRGKEQAVFETDTALTASAKYSAIPLAAAMPTNQFASAGAYEHLFGLAAFWASAAERAAAARTIYGSAGAALLRTFGTAPSSALVQAVIGSLAASAFGAASAGISGLPQAVIGSIPAAALAPSPALTQAVLSQAVLSQAVVGSLATLGLAPSLALSQAVVGSLAAAALAPTPATVSRRVVLEGTATKLAAGDYVLIVEFEGDLKKEKTTAKPLDKVIVDNTTKTTTIVWSESPTQSYNVDAVIYALRVTASPFGAAAPNWNTLSPTLTDHDGKHYDAPFADYWDEPKPPDLPRAKPPTGSALPVLVRKRRLRIPGERTNTLNLDAAYPTLKGTQETPDHALIFDGFHPPMSFHVIGVRSITASDYSTTAKVSQLKFRENVPKKRFHFRFTGVLAGAERLPLRRILPIPEPARGDTLVLAGLYPLLKKGQTIIVRSTRTNSTTGGNTVEAVLADSPQVDTINNITTVKLMSALQGSYLRADTVVFANVVSATQGETVKDEILGSADGTAFQSFDLKKKPLTYLPGADPDGLSALKSTLQVIVNGVRWTERPSLAASDADAEEYTTSLDDASQTTVTFGDGIYGAKPPNGKNNIHARYRRGMGTNGNTVADAVAQLLDVLPGVQKVTNPLPTLGGLDPESIAQIRTNAPGSLRTFGRAVSVQDYAALALTFPGVAKASAAWIDRDPCVPPYIQLTIVPSDGALLASQPTFKARLGAFLDGRRDPNVSLRLVDHTPVTMKFEVTVDIEDRYPRGATTAAVLAALTPTPLPGAPPGYFAFERLQLGQSILLSDLYRLIHAVDGVRDVRVSYFRRTSAPAEQNVGDDILLGSTELASLANDPADHAKDLVTCGDGGFVDT